MKLRKRALLSWILAFMMVVVVFFGAIPQFESHAATPYKKIEFNYSETVTCGTIRYISQISSNQYFNWKYWPSSAFGSYTGPGNECGTSCISMAMSYIGLNYTPKKILEAHNGKTYFDGWAGSEKKTDIEVSNFSAAVDRYINGNGKYSPVVIHLNYGQSKESNDPGHYVMIVDKVSSNVWTIVDPADSTVRNYTINGTTISYMGITNTINQVHQWYNKDAYICDHTKYNADGTCASCGKAFDWKGTKESASGIYAIVDETCPSTAPYEANRDTSITLKLGNQVELLGKYTNAHGNTWYEVSYDHGTKTGFVYNTKIQLVADEFFATGVVVTANSEAKIWSIPCSDKTIDYSYIVAYTQKGEILEPIRAVYNIQDHYWYEVKTAAGDQGWIYCDNTTFKSVKEENSSIIVGADFPSTILKQGRHVQYEIKTTNSTIKNVTGAIYNGTATSGTAVCDETAENVNSKYYNIYNSAIDYALPFGSLTVGNQYTLVISTDLECKYFNGSSEQTHTYTVSKAWTFKVVSENSGGNDGEDSNYIMTSTEFADKCYEIATEYKTLYVMGCFGAPMNSTNKDRYTSNHSYNQQADRTAMINAATADTFGFDCVCLIKGVLWGWNGDTSKVYGGASYASNGVSDMSIDTMLSKCVGVSTDFSNIEVGEILFYKDSTGYSHVGVYIGNGLAVESTPKWDNCVQVTAVANIGSKSGYNARAWYSHGKLTEFLDYTNSDSSGSDDTELRDLNVICNGFTPEENESLPTGYGYPVWGTVTSNYPLEKVVATLDGNEYATWKASDKTTTSFDINPTDINNNLKFGSLSAGKHTVTLTATDIYGRTQTFLVRSFYMVSYSCSHTYSSTYTQDESSHWKVCSKCGTLSSIEDHSYSNACDSSCDVCGYTRSVTHTYDNACDPTCNTCGEVRETSHEYDNACDTTCNVCGETRIVFHNYKTVEYTEEGHWFICNDCGHTTNLDEHLFGEFVAKDPTCTEAGEKHTMCATCGYDIVEEIEPLGHTYSDFTVTKAPTCTESGEKSSICERCGESVTEEIVPTGHTYGNYVITKQATCEENGEKVRNCSSCGNIETVTIYAKGHDYGEWYAVGSDSDGNETERRDCFNCGHYEINIVEVDPEPNPEPQTLWEIIMNFFESIIAWFADLFS